VVSGVGCFERRADSIDLGRHLTKGFVSSHAPVAHSNVGHHTPYIRGSAINRKRSIVGAAGFLVAGLWLGPVSTSAIAAPAASGPELFAQHKCDTCHSVAAAGIEAKVKVDKMKGPDLGGYKDTHGPGVLLQYQRQEIELDGMKHTKKYSGTPEDFDAILAWLGGLKAAE
jgi:hypothetical protein